MKLATIYTTLFACAIGVLAENHVVHFVNNCGSGTPMLIQGPNVLSHGEDHTSNGPLTSAIAYLNNGQCGFNGGGCTLVELTLINPDPAKPGSGSSADISLIPLLKFSQPAGFKFTNGCDGVGETCGDANCPNAFRKPDDNQVQVACQANDVNLEITFC